MNVRNLSRDCILQELFSLHIRNYYIESFFVVGLVEHSFSHFRTNRSTVGGYHLIDLGVSNRLILSLVTAMLAGDSFSSRRSRARPSKSYLRHWLLPGTLSEHPSHNRVVNMKRRKNCRGAVLNSGPPPLPLDLRRILTP